MERAGRELQQPLSKLEPAPGARAQSGRRRLQWRPRVFVMGGDWLRMGPDLGLEQSLPPVCCRHV